MSGFDAIFVGSSPNALAEQPRASAKSGARVCVVETANEVGGPVATEPFAEGFRADAGVAAITIDPDIARELGLEIEILRRDSATWLGDATGDPGHALRSAPELPRAFDDAVSLLRGIYRSEPPDVPALTGDDAATLGMLGASLAALGPRGMHEALRLAFLPVRDFAREAGLDEAASALLSGVAVRGLTEGPFAPGTTFGLLHRAAIDDALFRSSAKGGVQRVAEALAACARAAGAEIRVGAPGPLTIDLDDGHARGLRLADGTILEAARVVSDLDARATFTRLVSPRALDPEQNRAVRALRYRGSVARVHLALRALPALRGVERSALGGTLVVAPNVAAIERAWDDGKRGQRVERAVRRDHAAERPRSEPRAGGAARARRVGAVRAVRQGRSRSGRALGHRGARAVVPQPRRSRRREPRALARGSRGALRPHPRAARRRGGPARSSVLPAPAAGVLPSQDADRRAVPRRQRRASGRLFGPERVEPRGAVPVLGGACVEVSRLFENMLVLVLRGSAFDRSRNRRT